MISGTAQWSSAHSRRRGCKRRAEIWRRRHRQPKPRWSSAWTAFYHAKALPSIADAAGAVDIKILVDSGIRTGLDVVNDGTWRRLHLAWPFFVYALAAQGQAGVGEPTRPLRQRDALLLGDIILTGAKRQSKT
ncbi:alpha-hydroxy-acid oxidizing protein [Vibrio chagasii]|nr:alpha-hydroxy-acid oxidizing protein [Vibrio chagasii]